MRMRWAAGTDLFAPPVAEVRVASPSPERAETAKTPAIAVQPALLHGLVQDQDLAAEADLLDGVGPVAGDADHAWCLAALGDGLGELGVACQVGDVEAANVRGSLAAPQLQLNGAVEGRAVAVGGRVVDVAREQPELGRLERALGVRAWHGGDAVHVGSGGVERAGDERGRALDRLWRALARERILLWLVDALRRVHAVRDVHGHHVAEAALAGVHGVDGEASIALGRLGGLEALGVLGEGFALLLGLSDSGERHTGLNAVDGAERRLGLEGVEALGRDGGAVD